MIRLLAGFLAGLCFAACAPDAARFKQARAEYYASSDGDDKASEEAVRLFGALHSECGSDPAVLAYWGSLQLLEASHTWALWRKNSLSRQGIQAMDSAVSADPNNLEIRFVRAATTYNLPPFFHRRQQSEDDFRFLAERAEQAARSGRFDPRLAAASLYFNAEFLHQKSLNTEAIQNWTRAIRLDPQSRAARDSANELKKLQ